MDEFKEFIHNEIHKIMIDKWIEGERTHSDPGINYEVFWVTQNAQIYRENWEKSLCRTCIFCHDCGYNTLSACVRYEKCYDINTIK